MTSPEVLLLTHRRADMPFLPQDGEQQQPDDATPGAVRADDEAEERPPGRQQVRVRLPSVVAGPLAAPAPDAGTLYALRRPGGAAGQGGRRAARLPLQMFRSVMCQAPGRFWGDVPVFFSWFGFVVAQKESQNHYDVLILNLPVHKGSLSVS